MFNNIIKPFRLKKGDSIAIVSLSNGILGEDFCKYQLEIGTKRLEEFGLKVKFMNNTLKGEEYIKSNPQKRAEDLKQAFLDKDVKIIMSAIGGDDSYKIIPYLMNDEFKSIVQNNPKIFIGYSDTTNIHLFLTKLGVSTIYGHAFLTDIAELDTRMLEYTKKSFLSLFENFESYEILSSNTWFEERKSFDKSEYKQPRVEHIEKVGYEFINFKKPLEGILYGGCLESFYSIFTSDRYNDQTEVFEKYNILPTLDEWKKIVLFLETSEEKPNEITFKNMLKEFEKRDILKNVKCLILGKPQDNIYYDEYKKILLKYSQKYNLPIVLNINFGHSYPKNIIPYAINVKLDNYSKIIKAIERILKS
ncbi:S66 family peptidase [Spiroplasma tabanidicola]|uniref:LD-carboxypeptidase n=1 Tax=Spiroplasma tabanidicola TaxID=324079 RepID=A0A6I6C6W8_9MOLU|nr:S66 peptidase family protein [Spiroplasma tabanidicola]QGS51526.1 LD-carboxypeptidase [Spiroplasma tabanidicola]